MHAPDSRFECEPGDVVSPFYVRNLISSRQFSLRRLPSGSSQLSCIVKGDINAQSRSPELAFTITIPPTNFQTEPLLVLVGCHPDYVVL
jgi:hypothetical protein